VLTMGYTLSAHSILPFPLLYPHQYCKRRSTVARKEAVARNEADARNEAREGKGDMAVAIARACMRGLQPR
jgi:hypothetical protein